MKALSLWQPWASLIACGAKTIETRSWQPPARLDGQRIAIHAAKRTDDLYLLGQRPFADYLAPLAGGRVTLPLGAIIGTVRLVGCELITPELCRAVHQREGGNDELSFGDYRTGRYAWHLADPRPLAVPVPTIGRQGFWNVPDLGLGLVVT
jgi:hypothetical protein